MISDRDSTDNFMLLVYDKIEDYNKVIAAMKEKISKKPVLRQDERNYLYDAYDSLVKQKVQSIQSMNKEICQVENNFPKCIQNSNNNNDNNQDSKNSKISLLKDFRDKIIQEHKTLCIDLIDLISNTLMPNAKTLESKISYSTALGRYYSYIYHYSTAQNKEGIAQNVIENYEKAIHAAQKSNMTFNRKFVENVVFYTSFLADNLGRKDKAKDICSRVYSELVADEMIRQEHISGISISVLSDKISQWSG